MKTPKMYVVTWGDAYSTGRTFQLGLEVETDFLTESVGFLYCRDEKKIALAQSVDVEGKFRDLIVIPMTYVKKIRRVN